MFIKLLLGFLMIPYSYLCWADTTPPQKVEAPAVSTVPAQAPLPYYAEIMQILNSIEYSAFEGITKPEVALKLDFANKKWTLSNIHHYDDKGNILLEEGRYGLCAELSTYLYQRLQKIIGPQYDVKFARATETSFFWTDQSNHIILLMAEKGGKNVYLLDPSFHKYGNVKDLYKYQILGIKDTLSFIKDKSHDVSFLADQAMPLLIKEDLMLSFSVTSLNGKFDKDNFLFVISANRRGKIDGVNLLVVGKYNGQLESFQGTPLLEEMLNPQELNNLHNKVDIWIKQN